MGGGPPAGGPEMKVASMPGSTGTSGTLDTFKVYLNIAIMIGWTRTSAGNPEMKRRERKDIKSLRSLRFVPVSN